MLKTVRRHPVFADAALGVALSGLVLAGIAHGTHNSTGHSPTATDFAASVLAVFIIGIRRQWPRISFIVSSLAAVVFLMIQNTGHPILIMAYGIAAYTMASRTDRRTAWILAAAGGLVFYVGAAIASGVAFFPPVAIPALAFLGMVTALGDATRSRRAYLAATEERARRAEQTREEEAQRRVIQERLRIARELHDVIAHHIAVINVQAGAASHLIDRRPEQVKPALVHIRQAGDTVLQELASIIGVLRQSDDPDMITEPTRGLSRLPELLETVSAAGLAVEFQQEGTERALPAVVDLAAYRIVQEALTNAQKHGTGSVSLTVRYEAQAVGIDVVNAAAFGESRAGSGGGYGIVGMRERAAAADGTLDAYASPSGRFTVHATLPAHPVTQPVKDHS